MKCSKSLVMGGVVFLMRGRSGAHADTFTDYTINFLGPAGALFPTSGTIVYDSTAGALNRFSSFVVKWDGERSTSRRSPTNIISLPGSRRRRCSQADTASFSIIFPGVTRGTPIFGDLECSN